MIEAVLHDHEAKAHKDVLKLLGATLKRFVRKT